MNKTGPNKVYEITTKKQLTEILKLNLTTIVDFSAQWCGPCQKIKPLFYKLPIRFPNYVFLSVDVEDAEVLSAEYHIKALPTFVIMNGKGEFERFMGANLEKVFDYLVELEKTN